MLTGRTIAALLIALSATAACNRGDTKSPADGAKAAAGAPRSCCADPTAEALAPLAPTASAKKKRLRGLAEEARHSTNVLLSNNALESSKALLRRVDASNDAAARANVRAMTAELMMNAGDLDGAVRELESAIEIFPEAKGLAPAMADAMRFMLGMTWFRLAEKRNCVAHHTQESCIFPLRGGAVHIEPLGATRAKAVFTDLLERAPEYREAAWLLNVAHMALGTWPDGVPEEHRLTPAMIAPEAPFPHFVDHGAEKNVNRHTRAGSAVMEDFDRDGRADIMSSSFDPAILVKYLHGEANGIFCDRTAEAALADETGGAALRAADFDGDGRMDLLVLRGAGLAAEGAWPCSLLKAGADGRFTDVTDAAGIDFAAPARAAAVADADLDGDLDLVIGAETTVAEDGKTIFPSKVYENLGAMRFTDVTGKTGIATDQAVADVLFGDVNDDGAPDLFFSHRYAPNRLYENRGDFRFTDVTAAAGTAEPKMSTAAAFLDADQDGDLDLFVASHEDVMHGRAVAEYWFTKKVIGATQRYFENDGHGRFANRTAAMGLARPDYVLSAAPADLDNDGFPDLYLGTGSDEMAGLWPNVMLANDHGRRFLDVTRAAGLGHLQKTSAIAAGDVDGDGDIDLFLKLGGTQIDDAFGDVLFINDLPRGHFVEIDLSGFADARVTVGAKIRVRARNGERTFDRFAWAGVRGSTDGSASRVHVGLGDAVAIDEIEITWPTRDRKTTRLSHPPIDRVITDEGAAKAR